MFRQILVLLFLLSPLFGIAQLSMDGRFHQQPLQEILQTLEQKHGLVFSYTQDLIEDKIISVSFQKASLNEALTSIFANTDIEFEVLKESYVVLRQKSVLEEDPTLQICGTVKDPNGAPLAFATIYSPQYKQGITTDEDGVFSWEASLKTSDVIEISYVGFQSLQKRVGELQSCPDLSLSLPTYSLAEVIVKEYVTAGIEQSEDLDHVIIRPDKIDVVPGLTEADVLQLVQILPGVQSLDETASGLHIRGGTPDQNLILWDGIPVYNSGHFFGMISAFNPYIVDEVKVYRSGFGAQYGGRVSGVVDIRSDQKVPGKIKANAGINFTHTDASVVIPLFKQKSALTLSARRAYTDIIESPTYKKLSERVFQRGKIEDIQSSMDEEEDINSNLSFVFNDVNLKWLWKPSNKNTIAISAFGISDRLNFSASDDEVMTKDDLDLENGGLSFSWKQQWNPKFYSDLLISYTDLNNNYRSVVGDIDTSGSQLDIFQANNIEDFTLRWDHQWQLFTQLPIEFGYQFTDLAVERRWEFEDNPGEFILDQNTIHTGHLTLLPQWSRELRSQIGLRWSYSESLDQNYFEPRFSLQYIPNKQFQVSASAGVYRQFIGQAIEFNDLGLNQQIWVLADDKEDTPIAKGEHYSVGFIYHPSGFQLEVEAYHKRLANLTSFSPVFLESFREDNYSEGSGRVWGIDLLLKKRWKQYQIWLSYTYSRVKYTFETYNENRPFAAPHDRPHALTIMQQYKFKRWNFSMNWQFASGRVFTSADDIDTEDDNPVIKYNYDETNVNRLTPFHRLDLSILYRLTPQETRFQAKLGLSILNLYNRENILSRQYLTFFDDEEEEFVLDELDRPMLRFTPNLVFRMSF